MRQPLINVKTLFSHHLDEIRQEREDLVKARIENFFNRHRIPANSDESAPQPDAKVRTLYEKHS